MPGQPDKDIRDKIQSGVAGLQAGQNLFMGKMRTDRRTPDRSVFCLASGGPPQEAYIGSGEERRYSAVQIIIRSDSRGFEDGQTLARECRDAVHHQPIDGYIDVMVNETEPLYIGEDDDGHHEWSVNVELWHEEDRP